MSAGAGGSETAPIKKAIDIAGWNVPGNISFQAEKFASSHIAPLRCFLPESGPLVSILESSPIQDAVERYVEARKGAIGEKKSYQRRMGVMGVPLWLGVCIALAMVLIPHGAVGAFGLALGAGSSADEIAQAWQNWAPWAVYAGVIGTAILSLVSRPAGHYRRWQQHRATAEALRREIFKRVFDHRGEGGGLELPLKLEYFRRWQAELQREYFRQGCEQNERLIRRRRGLSHLSVGVFVLLGLVLASSAIAGLDEQGMPSALLRGPLLYAAPRLLAAEAWGPEYPLLLLGLLAVSAMAFYFALGALNSAKRNAPRYRNMLDNFEELLKEGPADRLTFARQAAALGNEAVVRDYAERVHSVMAMEINDWVRLADLDQGRDDPNYFRRGAAQGPRLASGA
ncbi:MAG: hypothetical protein ACLP7P_00335 [Rhodomicrobium sp.]